MKRLFRLSLWPLFAVALYGLAALAGAILPGPARDVAPGGTVTVGLVSGPIHYDFLLPATPETRDALRFASAGGVPMDHRQAAWVLVGWGSRAFYTATGTYLDLSPGTLWTAATGDAGVLRIDVLGPIDVARVEWLTLSDAGYRGLLRFIQQTRTGGPVPDAGFTDTDAFFEAGDGFHLFRTCNTWISEALGAAGMKRGLWTPLPISVRLANRWHGNG